MTATQTQKTSAVTDRRTLRFGRMSDLVNDVETLDVAGPVTAAGNWTPGQIVEHVAVLINYSLDGFPGPKAALPIRIAARLMRESILNKPMKPGIKLPSKFDFLVPEESVTWDEARGHLAAAVARITAGERMTHESPVFGEINHEQWEQLHCRHAEMHFSFLKNAT